VHLGCVGDGEVVMGERIMPGDEPESLDTKQGALFYTESSGKFDLIPSK